MEEAADLGHLNLHTIHRPIHLINPQVKAIDQETHGVDQLAITLVSGHDRKMTSTDLTTSIALETVNPGPDQEAAL